MADEERGRAQGEHELIFVPISSYSGNEMAAFRFQYEGKNYHLWAEGTRLAVMGTHPLYRGERILWVHHDKLASQAELVEWLGPEVASQLITKFLR